MVKDSQGNFATLGGSIFSKSDSETAYYKGPLGEMGYASTKKDETSVPKAAITGYTALGLGKQLLSATKAKEATTRTLGEQSVSKNATNKAAASADLKTLNPVEEAAIPAPSAPIYDPATGLNVIK